MRLMEKNKIKLKMCMQIKQYATKADKTQFFFISRSKVKYASIMQVENQGLSLSHSFLSLNSFE